MDTKLVEPKYMAHWGLGVLGYLGLIGFCLTLIVGIDIEFGGATFGPFLPILRVECVSP